MFVNSITLLIATGGGSGLLRPAPGTIGSLAALLVWISCIASAPLAGQLCTIAAVALIGTIATQRLLTHPHPWLGTSRKSHDPSSIVIDEWAGMWIAVLGHTPADYLLCFVLFRFFDALKPYPVRAVERIPGSIGVMADDLLAGVLASAVVVAIRVACAS